MRASTRRACRAGRSVICGLAAAATLSGMAHSTASPATTSPSLNISFGSGAPLVDTVIGQETTGQYIFSAYGGSITVNSAALSGQNGASYSIAKNTCTSGTVLNGSVTCEVDVQFAPQQQGTLVEAIAMTTSVGAANFDISTNGLIASLLVSPTLMDFGFQAYGTTSATRTLTLKNPNPIPVTLPYDFNEILEPGGDFEVFSTTCGTIPAHGSCAYQMGFTPSTVAAETGYWYLVTGLDDANSYLETEVIFQGTGVQDGASSVNISREFNTAGISNDSAHVTGGGLDGDGNVYSYDFLMGSVTWSGQIFALGVGGNNAVHAATLTLPTGQYYGLALLATGVNGNQANQTFTVTYSDGTSSALQQSLSDWKTPQHYPGESIAATSAYRLTNDGVRHNGPYYLYVYTLPLDHTKTAVSLTLPNNRNVAVLSLNVEVAGVPVTAQLAGLYNVMAVGVDGQAVGTGIDHHGSAISFTELASVPLNELLLAIPNNNVLDAVANATVPLPSGLYSTLHLDGMAVEGNEPNQTLTVNYQDGTSTAIAQGFSDWHTSQQYSRESIAVAMTYKLNPDGSKHLGTYNVYQYDIPIDASKLVSSVVLPKTFNVVILSVALKP